MAAFLYRYAGFPEFSPPEASPFRDVPTTYQFYTEITWLESTGITTGWYLGGGVREFRPQEPIGRDAMAAFLYRFNGAPDYSEPYSSPFADVAPWAPFYYEITWLNATEITTGWDVGAGLKEFRPTATITRDAMAAFLSRHHTYEWTSANSGWR